MHTHIYMHTHTSHTRGHRKKPVLPSWKLISQSAALKLVAVCPTITLSSKPAWIKYVNGRCRQPQRIESAARLSANHEFPAYCSFVLSSSPLDPVLPLRRRISTTATVTPQPVQRHKGIFKPNCRNKPARPKMQSSSSGGSLPGF